MQFNESMRSDWSNSVTENIKEIFKNGGLKTTWNKGYNMPHIVYWNLNGDKNGIVDKGDTENVSILSGFSPTAFYNFMENRTPMETLLNILNSENYDVIRNLEVWKKYFVVYEISK